MPVQSSKLIETIQMFKCLKVKIHISTEEKFDIKVIKISPVYVNRKKELV